MKYFFKTFGCQANLADSERIALSLEEKGLEETIKLEEADLVVINSCAVRESAENRVYGLVKKAKEENPKARIILTGCLLYQGKSCLRRKLSGVDLVLKKEWPEFIKNNFKDSKSQQIRKRERVLVKREDGDYALLPIMEGCNHFCTYCVVPYARGREVSRPMGEVIEEAEALVNEGYKNLLLLGQNVNSYHPDETVGKGGSGFKTPFADLLFALNEIGEVEKIAFLSSNPWDLNEEIIKAMALPKVSRFFHLPVQSGDEKILRRMNRGYTPLQYIELVKKIRRIIPDIKISTDIIVGFPGESEEAFNHTVELCQTVGFYKAYLAKYSPRPGTAAYRLKDDVLPAEKKRRWQVLEKLINNRKK
ncbi:MiaB/RimO family radical SAM methylthiotransferase [Candidatus Shapirobacteria bacterium]|nr:MiaB/RimO family radical SAM methylthiotransferase [Candidatus Shapirobacteria bacterium]